MRSLPCIFFGFVNKPCAFTQMLNWGDVSKATEGIYSVSSALDLEGTEKEPSSLAFQFLGNNNLKIVMFIDFQSINITISLFSLPAATRPVIYKSTGSVVFVKEGETARMFCHAHGSPLPFITHWIKVNCLFTFV